MDFIDTISQYERLVQAPRAILALHAQWSFPAMQAVKAIEHWERNELRTFGRSLPVFVAVTLPNDYHPRVVRWLESQSSGGLSSTGNGEVLWLERGQVVAKLLANPRPATLTNQTLRLWPSIGACDVTD